MCVREQQNNYIFNIFLTNDGINHVHVFSQGQPFFERALPSLFAC